MKIYNIINTTNMLQKCILMLLGTILEMNRSYCISNKAQFLIHYLTTA